MFAFFVVIFIVVVFVVVVFAVFVFIKIVFVMAPIQSFRNTVLNQGSPMLAVLSILHLKQNNNNLSNN